MAVLAGVAVGVGAGEDLVQVDVDVVEAVLEGVEVAVGDGGGGDEVGVAPVAEDGAKDVDLVGGETELVGSHRVPPATAGRDERQVLSCDDGAGIGCG
jgi:hypothetical protein